LENAISGLENAISGLENAISGLGNAISGLGNAISGLGNAISNFLIRDLFRVFARGYGRFKPLSRAAILLTIRS